MTLPVLRTERLILRPWKESDLIPFAELNADPKVMEFFAAPLSKQESNALAKKIQQEFEQRRYGYWAVEIPEKASFIGYIGLNYWNYEMPFAPCIDVGWRLAFPYWGNGYATEGARASLWYGFEILKFTEIVSMATIGNIRSHRVMDRIGMKYTAAEDFEHPRVPKGHPLSLRRLYRISKKEWCPSSTSEHPIFQEV